MQQTFDALLASGELLETNEFLRRVGCSRRELGDAVHSRRLFNVVVGGKEAYPAFYLDTRYDRRELETVCEMLDDLSGGSKWLFFRTPRASLAKPIAGSPTALARAGRAVTWPIPKADTYLGPSGMARTPLQALEDGELELVLRAAGGYAER